MDNKERRSEILNKLQDATAPISAVSLAKELGVSRQVIVGDVALLRAEGFDVIATSRGYMIQAPVAGKFIRKIACKHTKEQTTSELSAIISLGGEIIDVIITHPYYGDLTGLLNIRSFDDVKGFAETVNENEKLLSELTDGTHLHTIACRDKGAYDKIIAKLERLGFLLKT